MHEFSVKITQKFPFVYFYMLLEKQGYLDCYLLLL